MAPKAALKRPAARASAAGARGDLPAPKKARSVEADAAAGAQLLEGLTEPTWREALSAEFAKPYFQELAGFLRDERAVHTVHPPAEQVFAALNETPLGDVKVVILGQDPYHEPGQAHGMCFSVLPGVKPPPSLKNMYKELATDIPGFEEPDHGYLMDWARQGVLLLNATLTVREGHKEANSHARCGWQVFTDAVIQALNDRSEGVVFLLWGGFAQKKGKIVDTVRHRVLESAHPSPLSWKKWQGCRAFSQCNAALKELGRPEIDWRLGAEVDSSRPEAEKANGEAGKDEEVEETIGEAGEDEAAKVKATSGEAGEVEEVDVALGEVDQAMGEPGDAVDDVDAAVAGVAA